MREESEGIGSGQLRNAILGIERHRLSDACIPLTVVQYECCITFQRPACRNSVWNLQQSARLYVVYIAIDGDRLRYEWVGTNSNPCHCGEHPRNANEWMMRCSRGSSISLARSRTAVPGRHHTACAAYHKHHFVLSIYPFRGKHDARYRVESEL
jgi:hypothetical protein